MARLTKAQQIHEAIADDIVHGRLMPGDPLDEVTIAKLFGVSRTPIREAIRQLAAIGLVETQARRGAIVATLSASELLALQTEGERLVSAGRQEAYVEANNRFHETIYRGSHNRFLADLALSVRRRCAPFRRAQFETLGRVAKSHAEHGAVVEAIQRGDAELAAREMHAHIIVVRSAVDEVAGEAVRRGETASPDTPLRAQSGPASINRATLFLLNN